MELFVSWCSFIGAWLLFAGPVYQAAIELREENVADDKIRAAQKSVQRPPAVSAWWWLLPPARIILEQKRATEHRRQFMSILEPDDLESLMTFIHKATGWLYVSAGGLLIAVKETYELSVLLNQPVWVFWVTIIALILISVGIVASRIKRSTALIRERTK